MIENLSQHKFFKVVVTHLQQSQPDLGDELCECFFEHLAIIILTDSPLRTDHFHEVVLAGAAEAHVCVVADELVSGELAALKLAEAADEFVDDVVASSVSALVVRVFRDVEGVGEVV